MDLTHRDDLVPEILGELVQQSCTARRTVELAQSVLQQVEGFVETRLHLRDQRRDLSGNVGDGVEERLRCRLDVG